MSLSFHLLTSSGHCTPALVCAVDGIHIIRTIDPELPHQVSTARIFRSAGLSVCAGLIRTKLELSIDYFTDLGVSGPKLLEVWTSVQKTRSIIASLWQSPPQALIDLTSPALDKCWTLYDLTRSSLLHNWRLSYIAAEDYSTSLLLDAVFDLDDVVYQADKAAWIRTGLPQIADEIQDSLDAAMLRWSVNAVERYNQRMRGEESQDVETDWLLPLQTLHESLDVKNMPFEVENFEVTVAESYEQMLRRPRRKRKKFKNAHCQTEKQSARTTVDVACQTDLVQETANNNNILVMLVILLGLYATLGSLPRLVYSAA